uniref:Uncharacterized protein n=1 Tax=Timema poppense TaxID=170557 RepID=A0A7R9DD61_TIMPO|nr:unnamed protein product [Timema poppensis]
MKPWGYFRDTNTWQTKVAEEPAGVHVGGLGGNSSLNNRGPVHHRQRLHSPEEGHFQGQLLRRDHGAYNNNNNNNQLPSHHHLNQGEVACPAFPGGISHQPLSQPAPKSTGRAAQRVGVREGAPGDAGLAAHMRELRVGSGDNGNGNGNGAAGQGRGTMRGRRTIQFDNIRTRPEHINSKLGENVG